METALFLLMIQLFLPFVVCSNDNDAVLFRDVHVVTLHRGLYTTARRTSPIPQLQCVGGSAGCDVLVLNAVQCQNKGWDGVDVQWECKADMDNKYRFGKLFLKCEGYNSPDDPYILKGSCGLQYELEYNLSVLEVLFKLSPVIIAVILLVLAIFQYFIAEEPKEKAKENVFKALENFKNVSM